MRDRDAIDIFRKNGYSKGSKDRRAIPWWPLSLARMGRPLFSINQRCDKDVIDLSAHHQYLLRQWILEDARRQTGQIDAEIENVSAGLGEIARAQKKLALIEVLLTRMRELSEKAAAEPSRQLSDEFEACKGLVEDLSAEATVGGVSALWGKEEDLQRALEEMIGRPLD